MKKSRFSEEQIIGGPFVFGPCAVSLQRNWFGSLPRSSFPGRRPVVFGFLTSDGGVTNADCTRI